MYHNSKKATAQPAPAAVAPSAAPAAIDVPDGRSPTPQTIKPK
jgi:hypothetical protein